MAVKIIVVILLFGVIGGVAEAIKTIINNHKKLSKKWKQQM